MNTTAMVDAVECKSYIYIHWNVLPNTRYVETFFLPHVHKSKHNLPKMMQKSYLWKCFCCNFVLFQSLYVRLSRVAAFNFLLNFSYFDIKPSCGHAKLLRSLDLCVWKKIQIDAIHGFFVCFFLCFFDAVLP